MGRSLAAARRMIPSTTRRLEVGYTRSHSGHAARILVLTPIYPWAGNPTEGLFVQRQVEQLRRLGHECHVLNYHRALPLLPPFAVNLSWCRYSPRWLRWQQPETGMVTHRFHPRRLNSDRVPDIADSLSRLIEREPKFRDIQMIYAHWLWTGGAVGLVLRRRFGWPLAAIARGGEMYRWQMTHSHCREHVERVITGADLLLANCKSLANRIALLDPTAAARVKVVFNGCDAGWFAPAANKEAVRLHLGLDRGTRYMLTCATIASHKGILELAGAWREFSRTNHGWHLLVIGDASETEPRRALTQLGNRLVSLLGRMSPEKVRLYMQAADAYVQPSREEGMANATMEAMATGLPVISTDAGGQGELVIDGVTGWLVPRRNPVALAAAMRVVASDPLRAHAIGRVARRFIVNRYAPTEHARTLSGELNELVARREERILA